VKAKGGREEGLRDGRCKEEGRGFVKEEGPRAIQGGGPSLREEEGREP
jgi:hypothetical protein